MARIWQSIRPPPRNACPVINRKTSPSAPGHEKAINAPWFVQNASEELSKTGGEEMSGHDISEFIVGGLQMLFTYGGSGSHCECCRHERGKYHKKPTVKQKDGIIPGMTNSQLAATFALGVTPICLLIACLVSPAFLSASQALVAMVFAV
jgi:hypothetical protein